MINLLSTFKVQSFPVVGFVKKLREFAFDAAIDQVVEQRLERNILLDPMEGVHQHALMFERIGGAQIFEFHAAGRCHAEHHEQ